ncbi:outer membrane lipoprotein carrier protein LolA [bacterium]|nr:outer membrane lipoprotein carrier protein LolA [bacterium]
MRQYNRCQFVAPIKAILSSGLGGNMRRYSRGQAVAISINRGFQTRWPFIEQIFCACLLLGLIIVNAPVSCRAETDIIRSKALDGFKGWYGSVNTIHADFHQSTLNPLWGEEQEAKGEVCFKKPGQMRWEYKSPQKDIIIVNQEEFFWYVPEDNQVIKKKREEAFQGVSPMSILGENMDIEKDFEVLGVEEICKGGNNIKKHENNNFSHSGEGRNPGFSDKKGEGPQGYRVVLKPKMPQVNARKITIEVKASDFSLMAIEVEELSGGHNRIEFEGIKVNKDLSPGIFVFDPPPGVKVITQKDFPAW